MKPREMLMQERESLAEFLHTLSEDDWLVPSLCQGWRVRDVVAHLAVDALPPNAFPGAVARTRSLSIDKLNNYFVQQARQMSIPELLRHFEAGIRPVLWGHVTPSAWHSDAMVHQQDIRRPLGRPRVIPEERLHYALAHPDFGARPRRYTKGLRFVATDVDWAKGRGPEVQGAGEALVLAMAGRPVVLNELKGPGVPVLAARMR